MATIDTHSASAGKRRKTSWAEDVVAGFHRLGGSGHLSAIYEAVLAVRKENGHRVPSSSEAIIRRVIEEHSSETESFKQGKDIFTAPNGLGAGYWALR